MLTVDRRAGAFAGLRSTIVGQRKNKATIHPMLNLPNTPFPRRVAASFNQALEPMETHEQMDLVAYYKQQFRWRDWGRAMGALPDLSGPGRA
jgi:hypothetical protein